MLAGQATAAHTRRMPPQIRWILAAAATVLLLSSIGIVILARNWPFRRQALIDVFQERTLRTVTIGKFHQTWFPPGCVAEDIAFLHRVHKSKPPLITVQKLEIRGSYWGLFTVPKQIPEVRVTRMHLLVPPKNGKSAGVMPLTDSHQGTPLVIGKIVADGALLEFEHANPNKEPYQIALHKLALHDVGAKGPMHYFATLAIETPPGEIRSRGNFGPWNAEDPGATPVNGAYSFEKANLGVSKLVSGMLSSQGRFEGELDTIRAQGSAEVPDFHVKESAHSTRLATDYQAVVNGTDGDTFLDNVIGKFGRTAVAVKGSVAGEAGEKGKTTTLDLAIRHGRIEDLFSLFILETKSPITGSAAMRAKVVLPPGKEDFLRKLRMDGDFGIGDSQFTKQSTQQMLNRLSESARGMNKKEQEEDPETVLSDLKGHFSCRNGVATLTNLTFGISGGTASLHGTYDLITYQYNLRGKLWTKGDISQTQSGFKSFMLKVIQPFLKKKQSTKEVPIKITGDYHHPQLALDF